MKPHKSAIPVACTLSLVLAAWPSSIRADGSDSRDAALWPFAVDSPWNLPLGSAAELESPDAACSKMLRDEKIGTDINAAQWSHPVYVAATTDPLVKITIKSKVVATIPVPSGAEPAQPRTSDSDAHLHIVDPQHRYVHEMWHAKRRTTGISVEGYSRIDLSSAGVGEGGERAYGGSAIGGLIRRPELASGIRHALAVALPRTHLKLGPVWPAVQQDNGAETTYHGTVPMGQLVALSLHKTDLDTMGLSPAGKTLAQALIDYGAYVVDASSDLTLYAEPSAEADIDPARADLIKLRPFLRCVKNASKTAVGGPGTRVAPLAAPLRAPLPAPTSLAATPRAKAPKEKALK